MSKHFDIDGILTDYRSKIADLVRQGVVHSRPVTTEALVRIDTQARAAILAEIEKGIGEIPPESEHWRYNGGLKGEINAVLRLRRYFGIEEK